MGCGQAYPLLTEGMFPCPLGRSMGRRLGLTIAPKYATVNKCEIKTEITTDSHKPSVLVTGQA